MTMLYSCRHAGDQYRITKFDNDMNVEASYLCTLSECECPAGVRDTCRHRQMLHKFLARDAVNTDWMLDYDRNGWVQTDLGEALSGSAYGLGLSQSETHTIEYTAGTATANITASEIDERIANHPFPTSPIVEHLVDKTYEAVQALAPAKPFRRGL